MDVRKLTEDEANRIVNNIRDDLVPTSLELIESSSDTVCKHCIGIEIGTGLIHAAVDIIKGSCEMTEIVEEVGEEEMNRWAQSLGTRLLKMLIQGMNELE